MLKPLLLVHALVGVLPPAADTVVIPDPVQCDTCEISLTQVATLGGSGEHSLLADNMGETVARDGTGAYWLWSYTLSTYLWRFAPNGEASTIGREGRGPREYWDIVTVGSAEDGRLVVFDVGNTRLDVFSPEGTFLESHPFRGPFSGIRDIAAVGGDTVLIAAVARSGASLGVPLHAVDISTGTVFASLGAVPEVWESQITRIYQERRVSASSTVVASGHLWQYQIDLFDWTSRSPTTSYLRVARWFRPVQVMDVNPPRTRPPPTMMGVKMLEDGSALVLLRRPRPNWLEGYVENDNIYAETSGRATSLAAVYETVLEHLDLVGGRVLARKIVPGSPMAFISDGRQVALLDDRGMIPRILVYDIELR